MSRQPRIPTANRLDRADRRMAPGGRMWSESPLRDLNNRKMLLPGVGAPGPSGTVPDAVSWGGSGQLFINSGTAPTLGVPLNCANIADNLVSRAGREMDGTETHLVLWSAVGLTVAPTAEWTVLWRYDSTVATHSLGVAVTDSFAGTVAFVPSAVGGSSFSGTCSHVMFRGLSGGAWNVEEIAAYSSNTIGASVDVPWTVPASGDVRMQAAMGNRWGSTTNPVNKWWAQPPSYTLFGTDARNMFNPSRPETAVGDDWDVGSMSYYTSGDLASGTPTLTRGSGAGTFEVGCVNLTWSA